MRGNLSALICENLWLEWFSVFSGSVLSFRAGINLCFSVRIFGVLILFSVFSCSVLSFQWFIPKPYLCLSVKICVHLCQRFAVEFQMNEIIPRGENVFFLQPLVKQPLINKMPCMGTLERKGEHSVPG